MTKLCTLFTFLSQAVLLCSLIQETLSANDIIQDLPAAPDMMLVSSTGRRTLEEHDALPEPDLENETKNLELKSLVASAETIVNDNSLRRLDEVTATYVVYNGKKYMTLDSADPVDTNVGCQVDRLQIPAGFRLAKNNADSLAVISLYGWGTHCLVLADGSSWTTKNFHPGNDCWINKNVPLVEFNLDGYVPRGCARRILLEEKSSALPACELSVCTSRTVATCEAANEDCTCQLVGKTGVSFATVLERNAVGYHNRVYRTMDAVDPTSTVVGCQTAALKVPKGWQLASTWNDWEARSAAAEFPWSTNCVAINDGKNGFRGWGSKLNAPLKECKEKGMVAINKKQKTYRPKKCQKRILLMKADTGFKCISA